MKAKLAIFEFSCCEGCQLQIVNLEDDLLELADKFEILRWREASSYVDPDSPIDFAFVEGSVSRPGDEDELRKIRARSKFLIAFGACATIGGVNKIKDNFDLPEARQYVYGPEFKMPHLEVGPAKALREIVPVDYDIQGCPIHRREFVYFVKCLLMGKTPEVPDYPVCVECKANENMCLWDIGEICLGPVIRAGCGCRCPTSRFRCFGCRGYIDEPNIFAIKDVIRIEKLKLNDLKNKLELFGSGHKPTYE
jgi:coenzyme F420-reducing hydrogenase gamma subunit